MKMLTVSLLVCALMALAAASDNSTSPFNCPKTMHGHCSKFVEEPLTWAEAERNCVSMKANLESALSMPDMLSNSWIGGSDCQQDNVWLWSNGKDFSKTNWCPSVAPGYKHGCIMMTSDGTTGKTCWVNRDCSERHPYTCGYDF